MPGHSRRVLLKSMTNKQYFPDMSWDYRGQSLPKEISGACTASLTLADNTEHHVGFLVTTLNECHGDIDNFIEFVLDEVPGPSHRTICTHFADDMFRSRLHAYFERSRLAMVPVDVAPYWDYGAKLIYDLNHIHQNLKKQTQRKDWQLYYAANKHSRTDESNAKWNQISDATKNWFARMKPPITNTDTALNSDSPCFTNGRRCARKTLSISQRDITIAEQKNAVEKRKGQRKMDVSLT